MWLRRNFLARNVIEVGRLTGIALNHPEQQSASLKLPEFFRCCGFPSPLLREYSICRFLAVRFVN